MTTVNEMNNTNSEELKPCPFCGSPNVTKKHDDGLFWVACKFCGATGPNLTKYSGEEGEKFIDWNTRHSEDSKMLDWLPHNAYKICGDQQQGCFWYRHVRYDSYREAIRAAMQEGE